MKTMLKAVRESRTEYTQEDMAKILGISLSTYSKWEQGQRDLRAPEILRLVEILNATSDEILGSEYANVEYDGITDNTQSDRVELLETYDALNSDNKDIAITVIKALLALQDNS